MALIVGGGQSGFGSFTGGAQALEIAGDFAYAYSGSVNTAGQNVDVTVLEFTTGNYLFVGGIYFTKDNDDGDDLKCKVYLNESLIIAFVEEFSSNSRNNWAMPIIIPPYTKVKVTMANMTSPATVRPVFAVITGELQR